MLKRGVPPALGRHRTPSLRARGTLLRVGVAACLTGTLLYASPAAAYRPFDGTDADVTEQGYFELELGPAHFFDRAGQSYLIAPNTVLNLGILPGTELVVDFNDYLALGALNGRPRVAFLGTDVLIKHVLREGCLQGKTGLSIAIEAGPLTPEYNGIEGFGASGNLILSQRWDFGTVHFDEWPQYSRAHHLELFSGVIAEGPHEWRVRPVLELFYDKQWAGPQTVSALGGLIWTARESFVLDLGVRGARIGEDNAVEIRLGFTWSLPVWGQTESATSARLTSLN